MWVFFELVFWVLGSLLFSRFFFFFFFWFLFLFVSYKMGAFWMGVSPRFIFDRKVFCNLFADFILCLHSGVMA